MPPNSPPIIPVYEVEIADYWQNEILSKYEFSFHDPDFRAADINIVKSKAIPIINEHSLKISFDSYNVTILRKILLELQGNDIKRLRNLINLKISEAEEKPTNRHPQPIINTYLTDGFKLCLDKFKLKLDAFLIGLTQKDNEAHVEKAHCNAIKGTIRTALKQITDLRQLLKAPAVEHSSASILQLEAALTALNTFEQHVKQINFVWVN